MMKFRLESPWRLEAGCRQEFRVRGIVFKSARKKLTWKKLSVLRNKINVDLGIYLIQTSVESPELYQQVLKISGRAIAGA